MGILGDVLEFMHGAATRLGTVQGTMRRREDGALAAEATRRYQESTDPGRSARMAFATRGIQRRDEIHEMTIRFWIAAPGRFRVEIDGAHGSSFSVHDGPRWWSYSPTAGATTNDGSENVSHGHGGFLDPMLDPTNLVAVCELTVVGDAQVAGRSGFVVRARPRRDPLRWGGLAVPAGAEEPEVVVDRERGVLLRSESRLDGQAFIVTELETIAFDVDIPAELLRFTPPPGVEIRSAMDQIRRPAPVSLDEAIRRAPFTIFLPERVEGAEGLDVSFSEPTGAGSPTVSLSYFFPFLRRHLRIQQTSSEGAHGDALEWERLQRGERVLYLSQGAGMGYARIVRTDREGTHIYVTSDLDRDELLDLVVGMVPAPFAGGDPAG